MMPTPLLIPQQHTSAATLSRTHLPPILHPYCMPPPHSRHTLQPHIHMIMGQQLFWENQGQRGGGSLLQEEEEEEEEEEKKVG
mmetsp:Transcript_48571/g.71203  ORF Transcript_48571/g.71203 Transcript_48571/m.71203 type:complete len:83 (+) Transcript_48571:322-570(+)